MNEQTSARVFLAYNSKDRAEVLVLARWLEARGYEPWLDDGSLRAGKDWRAAAAEALESSQAVLVCLGPHGVGEEQFREYAHALEVRKDKGIGYFVTGVLLRTIGAHYKIPASMRVETLIDLREAIDYQRLEAELRVSSGEQDPGAISRAYEAPLLRSTSSGVRFEGPGGGNALPVDSFTGRQPELQQLEELLSLSSSEAVAVIVCGGGGIGKSTLAQQFVATRAPQLFPEGVFWLDGKSMHAELERLACQFGWRFDPDAPQETRCRELSHALAERSVLLVIDDLPQGERQPCIPLSGGRARTLITSRGRRIPSTLVSAPARFVALDVWSPARCRQYLRARVPGCADEPDADLDALCGDVGHLPFGLMLIATLLLHSRGLRAATLHSDLKQAPQIALDHVLDEYELHNMPSVAALFSIAYDALSDRERRVLLCLAQCARAAAETVAAIAELALKAAVRDLNSLADQSLVEYARGADRPWYLHDLTRQFVRTQPGSNQLEAAHLNFVFDYFLRHADPQVYEQRDRAVDEATAALERLLDKRDAAGSTRLFNLIYQHFRTRGLHDLALQLGERVLALQEPNSSGAAQCLFCLAWCYRVRGEIQHAIKYLQRALESYREQHDHQGAAHTLAQLGTCYRPLGDMKNAVRCFNDALELHETLGQLADVADDLGNLGSCWLQLRDARKALRYHERALAIHRERNAPDRMYVTAEAIGNLGASCAATGDYARAIACLTEALEMNRQLGTRESELRNIANLGSYYQLQGETAQAVELLSQALAMADEIGAVEEQIKIRVKLALIGERQGNVTDTLVLLQRAHELVQAAGITDGNPIVATLRGALARLKTQI